MQCASICTCRNSFHKYLSWGSCSWRASVSQQPFSISLFDRVDVALRWYGLMLIFCRWMRKSGCSSCVIYVQQQLQLQLGVALPSERVLVWHRTRPVLHGTRTTRTERCVREPHMCFENQTFKREMKGKVKGFESISRFLPWLHRLRNWSVLEGSLKTPPPH